VRGVNKAFLMHVENHAWDVTPHKCHDLIKWNKCFPSSIAIEYESDSFYMEDVSFYLLPHLEYVFLQRCCIYGAAFRNLHTLLVPSCNGLTGETFEHLQCLTTLDVSGCDGFKGKFLLELRGLTTLFVDGCLQLVDEDFINLSNLGHLSIAGCEFLGDLLCNKPIKKLVLKGALLHGNAFQHLKGIETLDASNAVISAFSYSVSASTIVWLNLDGVEWGDFDVVKMPNLRMASLRETHFTTLRAFRATKRLDLTGAWLDGLRDFRGALDYLDVSRGTYSSPYFLTNIESIDVLVSYECNFEPEVFECCPRVRCWSVGCRMLELLDQVSICEKMQTEFVESCHEEMCYC
jgi:hypothetical protein